jgi:hypothetical protein
MHKVQLVHHVSHDAGEQLFLNRGEQFVVVAPFFDHYLAFPYNTASSKRASPVPS